MQTYPDHTDPIYLDYAATTPLRPEARQAMEPWLQAGYANPSSIYRAAQQARGALDTARDSIAECLGAHPTEIIFTSGGSEGNNAAVKGTAWARQSAGRHLITTAIEHHAVLYPMQELRERFGFDLSLVAPEPDGIVDPDAIARAVRPDTTLVSVMWVNNEIGTIQPVEAIGQQLRSAGIPFHVDAVQAAGAIAIDLHNVPIDLLTISAHKFHGPKGVGALYVRRGTPWWPLIAGGGQERDRRAGTENVAGIVGMAESLRLAVAERQSVNARVRELRDRLLIGLQAGVPDLVVNGDMNRRLPNNLNVSFAGLSGESLVVALDRDGLMASSGSACTSGSTEPSHVLEALGLPKELLQGALRLTLGAETTAAEIDRAVDVISAVVSRMRGTVPRTAPHSATL